MKDFVPENELEVALLRAASDPVARPDFYRELQKSWLFMIDDRPVAPGAPPQEPGFRRAGPDGEELSTRAMQLDGVAHFMVFSSLSRIQEATSQPVPYVALPSLNLFRMFAGHHGVLNPGAGCGKRLSPVELKRIVDGSILRSRGTFRVPPQTELFYGQPAEYPSHITALLERFFATKRDVRAAYLAQVYIPSLGDPPHVLIGVDAEGDWDALIGEVWVVLEGVARPKEILDFVKIDANRGVWHFGFDRTEPFYSRKSEP